MVEFGSTKAATESERFRFRTVSIETTCGFIRVIDDAYREHTLRNTSEPLFNGLKRRVLDNIVSCVSMAFTADILPAQAISFLRSSTNGCCLFRDHHGPSFVSVSFPN